MKDEWEREKQRLLNTILGSQQEATIDFSLDQSTVVKEFYKNIVYIFVNIQRIVSAGDLSVFIYI